MLCTGRGQTGEIDAFFSETCPYKGDLKGYIAEIEPVINIRRTQLAHFLAKNPARGSLKNVLSKVGTIDYLQIVLLRVRLIWSEYKRTT